MTFIALNLSIYQTEAQQQKSMIKKETSRDEIGVSTMEQCVGCGAIIARYY